LCRIGLNEPELVCIRKEVICLTKYEIAKDITIALISDKNSIAIGDIELANNANEQLAENVAAFYNMLIQKLDITE